ncbi:hypothetical protein [Brachybacterium hainanense]|uniref:ABC transporter permease n=1 Tax=Brachybacterium hainanense TaxID=1541174 RepID=A0ABV6RGD3_9MICO
MSRRPPPGPDPRTLWERADGRSTLPAVREAWGRRRGARTGRDTAYLIYLVVLTIAVFGLTPARALMIGLARPDTIILLTGSQSPQLLTAGWLLLCAGAVLVGTMRGPVVMTPFFTATLGASAMPRHLTLRWPLLRSAAVLGLAGACLGAVIGGTLLIGGGADGTDVLLMTTACTGAGLIALGPWTAGEVLSPDRPDALGLRASLRRHPSRRVLGAPFAAAAAAPMLALVLALAALAAALAPVPWGIGAVLWSGTTPPEAAAWAFAFLLSGASTVVLCLTGLDLLHGRVLSLQAGSWSAAGISAITGDLSAAAGSYRALPRTGRRLGAMGRRGRAATAPVLLYLRRDLVALLRTPARLVVGVLAGTGSFALLVLAADAQGPLRWVGMALAGLGVWAASGVLVDGMRHAVATLGAPVLLGHGVRIQLLLHAVAPGLLLLLLAGLGGACALAGGAEAGSVSLAFLLAVISIVGRARDAAKGPMPLRLAAPMPTAMGDASILPMLLWQGDAVLRAVGAAVLLALVSGMASWAGLAVAAGILALLLIELAVRLKELSS